MLLLLLLLLSVFAVDTLVVEAFFVAVVLDVVDCRSMTFSYISVFIRSKRKFISLNNLFLVAFLSLSFYLPTNSKLSFPKPIQLFDSNRSLFSLRKKYACNDSFNRNVLKRATIWHGSVTTPYWYHFVGLMQKW